MTPQSPVRAIIIPVLDYSPASEYNILTLLNDLETIEGEVIIVFNDRLVAEELKDHPLITRYAVMKQNVGVSRAWNIGIQMAEADLVHIVNSDAHITARAVEALEQGLRTLDNAVCTGPQGSFFDFESCEDHLYFDTGDCSAPLRVDGVSGFFFCLDRRRMAEHGLQFDTRYTPCYFEEWDFGLQVRRAGLSCWIVPTTAYDHHWSGSLNALQTVPYLGREESKRQIHDRNRAYFLAKWGDIVRREGRGDLLTSLWRDHLAEEAHRLLERGDADGVRRVARQLEQAFPDDGAARSLLRFCRLLAEKRGSD